MAKKSTVITVAEAKRLEERSLGCKIEVLTWLKIEEHNFLFLFYQRRWSVEDLSGIEVRYATFVGKTPTGGGSLPTRDGE